MDDFKIKSAYFVKDCRNCISCNWGSYLVTAERYAFVFVSPFKVNAAAVTPAVNL